MADIRVISSTSKREFVRLVDELLNDGYMLSSSSCGFINSAQYDYINSFQAILIMED